MSKTPYIAIDGQSEGEAAFCYYLRTIGRDLPEWKKEYSIPEGNRHGETNKTPFRADFAWPEHRVLFEVMGRGHERGEKYRKDLERHNLLTSWGYRVLYATTEQIRDDPESLIALLRVMLTQERTKSDE